MDSKKENTAASHPAFTIERRIIDAASAQRMASKCSDYNDSRHEARNFNLMEFDGIIFKDEDLSNIEAAYSKFTDCKFANCKLSRLEANFAEFNDCLFENSNLENSNFSFAKITNTVFKNSNLNSAEFSFACGDFLCSNCMMEHASAQNANLNIVFANVNANGFEANSAAMELTVNNSNLRRAEFNDGTVKGKITQSDLTCAEFNRSNLAELELTDCATQGIETEGSENPDNSLEDELQDFFSSEE